MSDTTRSGCRGLSPVPRSSGQDTTPRPFQDCEAPLKGSAAPLRVAAYIRVSRDDESLEHSFLLQKAYYTRLIENHPGWLPVGVYMDYAVSGTSKAHRTGFARLLRHCREGRIDRVLCKSVSRFSRNTADFLKAIRLLLETGTAVYFEKENLDSFSLNGAFVITTFGAIAQEESRSISANIRWGLKKHFAAGECPNIDLYGYRYSGGRIRLPSGYTYAGLVLCEEEARIVRRIYAEALQGTPLREIARTLNREHVTPPLAGRRYPLREPGRTQCAMYPSIEDGGTRRQTDKVPAESIHAEPIHAEPAQIKKIHAEQAQAKKTHAEEAQAADPPADAAARERIPAAGWTGSRIRRILSMERYTGDVLLQKTYTRDYLTHTSVRNDGELNRYLIHDHHPAIISRECYDQVQLKLAQNRRGPKPGRRALTGLLTCAYCGRSYHISNCATRPIWRCAARLRNEGITDCPSDKVYEEQILDMLQQAILERFLHTPIRAISDVSSNTYSQTEGKPQEMRVEPSGEKPGNEEPLSESHPENRTPPKPLPEAPSEAGALRDSILGCLEHTLDMEPCKNQDTGSTMRLVIGPNSNKSADTVSNTKRNTPPGAGNGKDTDVSGQEELLLWLRSLGSRRCSMGELLGGLTGEHAKALLQTITVYSPLSYTICWFDGSRTSVTMTTNVVRGGKTVKVT